MTPERRAAIRERLAKATPGPWRVKRDLCGHSHVMEPSNQPGYVTITDTGPIYSAEVYAGKRAIVAALGLAAPPENGTDDEVPDLVFIAHSRQDVEDLLAALEAAEGRITKILADRDAWLPDFPENDGTDFAHPAWWRGQERGADAVRERLEEILNGKDDGRGVFACPRLQAVREQVLALRAEVGQLRQALGRDGEGSTGAEEQT